MGVSRHRSGTPDANCFSCPASITGTLPAAETSYGESSYGLRDRRPHPNAIERNRLMNHSTLLITTAAILSTNLTTLAAHETCCSCEHDLAGRTDRSCHARPTADGCFPGFPDRGLSETDCRNGFCDVDSRYPQTGCDGEFCEVGFRHQDHGTNSFPYVSERSRRNGPQRRLSDPFRPASSRQQRLPAPDRRDYRLDRPQYQPADFEARRRETRRVSWNTNIRHAVDQAAWGRRQILVQVSASWCSHCQRMKNETYTDPELVNLINERFVAVAIDADQQREFVERMEIRSLPTTLIVGSDLRVLSRLQGFQSSGQLLQALSR